ncbi:MAG: hypothetical protein Q8K89_12970, partial [Actinomycetota bacterium]|nr:hypothetical protein [Actinomycetota bacterium]
MTFDELERDRSIERALVGPAEMAELLRLARRDVRTAAALIESDLDWAFAVAYNGVLQSSVAYMASRGYRPRSSGKHFNTFRFMIVALPDESEMIGRLQRLRKKRNSTVYEHVGLVGESEARDIIDFAARYIDMMTELMPPEVAGLLEGDET